MQWKIAPRVRRVVSSHWSLTWLGGRWVVVGSCCADSGELPRVHRFSVPKQFGSLTLKCSVLQPLFEWEIMQIFLWEIVILCCRSHSWVRQGWFSRMWWQRCADSPGSLLWAHPFWTLLPAVKNGHLVAQSQSTALEMLVSWKCDYLTMYGLVMFVFCLVEVSSTGHPDTGVIEVLFVEPLASSCRKLLKILLCTGLSSHSCTTWNSLFTSSEWSARGAVGMGVHCCGPAACPPCCAAPLEVKASLWTRR